MSPRSLVWMCGLAALCSLPVSAGAAKLSRATIEALDAQVRAVHEKQKNVGLAATVRRSGEVLYARTMGLADVEHHVAVTEHTRFGIASITKVVTAAMLLELVAEGAVDLDAPIQKYVPTYPEKPQGTITVRMLATHRSGIPHPGRTPELFATHYASATEAVAYFAADTLLFAPGTDERYSSSNYNLLAAAIEGVRHENFMKVVENEILKPLGLHETSFDDVLRPLDNRTRRYSYYHPWTYEESDELFVVPLWDYSFNVGGGNLISTSGDVAALGEALIRPGLLPAPEHALLWEWFGDTDESGDRVLYATGANPGVQAGLAVYPDRGISAAILSNTWGIGSRSAEMTALAKKLARTCMTDK